MTVIHRFSFYSDAFDVKRILSFYNCCLLHLIALRQVPLPVSDYQRNVLKLPRVIFLRERSNFNEYIANIEYSNTPQILRFKIDFIAASVVQTERDRKGGFMN